MFGVWKPRQWLSQYRKHNSPPLDFSAQCKAHSPAKKAAPPSQRRLVEAQEMMRQAQSSSAVRSKGFYSVSQMRRMKAEVARKEREEERVWNFGILKPVVEKSFQTPFKCK